MLDYVIIAVSMYILYRLIYDSIRKRIFIKVIVDKCIGAEGELYMNLYDYSKGDILPRGIDKSNSVRELG